MIYYKGFKKDLKCLSFQYEIGQTYTYSGNVTLCHKGFHYCGRLSDVFVFYGNNGDHRFCIVEPDGNIINGGDKHVCNTIKIVRELSKEEIGQIVLKEEQDKLDRIFCLDVIRDLQSRYNFMIGGSVSLHLQGFSLEREGNEVDLDIIMPYYQKLITDENLEIEEFDGRSSGCDYSTTYAISTNDGRFIKVDVRITPTQKYDIVEYKRDKYKVCEIMTTLEAKCRYAMEGNKKHRTDILFLLNKNKEE